MLFLKILGIIALIALVIVATLWQIRRRANFKRSLSMVFLRISVPIKDSKEDREREAEQFSSGKSQKEVNDVMTHFFEAIHSVHSGDFVRRFTGQDFFSCEYVVLDGQMQFFLVMPSHLKSLFDKQITAFYPDVFVEQVEDYNIFRQGYKATGVYMRLGNDYIYPFRNYEFLGSDPFNNIANTLSKIENDEGAAIQVMLRPMKDGWQERGQKEAQNLYSGKKKKSLASKLNPFAWIGTVIRLLVHGAENEEFSGKDNDPGQKTTPMTDELVKLMEAKNNKVGFETVIRVVGSAKSLYRAKQITNEIGSAFAQYNAPNCNGFKKSKYYSMKALLKGFILRSIRPGFFQQIAHPRKQIFSSQEVASVFHFPNIKYNQSPVIKWQEFKIAPAPSNLPTEGLFLGNNIYRGDKRAVHIKQDDRRRHFYIIGKSGTGKSTILKTMLKQDAQGGRGMCLIDPHGDLVEGILPHIPRSRADDIVVFDPGDLGRPMGLNIMEADNEDEKEFMAQEALAIFIKMFGEEIMGPRLQDYFRNGALTLMDDEEEGATIIDIPRLFADESWQRYKINKVRNPVVKSFWEKQMAMTGQRERQEIIPYFAAKFGPFVTNAQIRNIIGQVKSGFDFRDVMDNGKILLCNLSKGKLGDLNSQLLGMIMVAKLQMAAMSRVDTPEDERLDFYMYVDEFQNFVTDSFASILSEARKYRLNLVIAHQYISQITKMSGGGKGTHEDTTIRDAVFGNVGSMMCFKIGAQDAEYMSKEFSPVFSEQDLVNIANYQAYIKLNIDNATSRAFSMSTVYDPDKGDMEAAEAFRQLSRLKYARERSFVEREIYRRVGAATMKKAAGADAPPPSAKPPPPPGGAGQMPSAPPPKTFPAAAPQGAPKPQTPPPLPGIQQRQGPPTATPTPPPPPAQTPGAAPAPPVPPAQTPPQGPSSQTPSA